jgi:aminoglycoside 3'-phosphotransferase II
VEDGANPGGVTIDRLVAELPPAIAELGADALWQVAEVSPSGTTRWRLHRPGATVIDLKVAPGAGGGASRLRGEAERLQVLRDLFDQRSGLDEAGLAVPDVVASVTDIDSAEHYLATTVPPGVPAGRSEARGDAETLVRALARGLRVLHELPADAFPFAAPLSDRVAEAAERVERHLVDTGRFAPIHARCSPAQLLAHLRTMSVVNEEPVVVHGRPVLDHTHVEGGRVVGYTELGSAGVSDRYLDLAVVARQLADHVSPHALGPFFDAYGIDRPDLPRLDLYLLLDELR